MILSNLLDNAARYTNDGGRIWATAHRTDDGTEATISNTGCSLTDEQISQVFDCFWRGDSSRRDIGVHCGLGLALVQRLVRAFGGSVSAQRLADEVFTVRMTFPRAQ
jgi:signal transduction histidine kinase